MKTASRILGTAFFHEGFQVQDAPRYGAERRGAPIFAYVRADRSPIFERGVIPNPDLVVVADDTLVAVAAAGVLEGLDEHAVLLIHGHEDAELWRARLNTEARVLVLPAPPVTEYGERPHVGTAVVGAAAAVLGVIGRDTLRVALDEELAGLGAAELDENFTIALAAFDDLAGAAGAVGQRPLPSARGYADPGWIEVPLDAVQMATPTIHAAANSVQVRTGLWRTMRPVLAVSDCNKCVWVCGSYCPDGAISMDGEGYPLVDYDHCKGCLICVAQCPKHAFLPTPERAAGGLEEGGAP